MLVRDGASTLHACLKSVASLVDELIVVDTGSRDNSVDIARSFGAKVIQIEWPDDFSVARNQYLSHTRCKWILSIDADEVLAPVTSRQIRELLKRRPNTAFMFDIRNYRSAVKLPAVDGGAYGRARHWTLTRTVRLFPRRPDIRYRFPVHESLLPTLRVAGVPVVRCGIQIYHAGPVTHDQYETKVALYQRLGRKKIAKYPEYGPGYLELGKLSLLTGDKEEAKRLFMRAVRLDPFNPEAYFWFRKAFL
jgi:glycosyltransferase involved in cell wall biosynthesis